MEQIDYSRFLVGLFVILITCFSGCSEKKAESRGFEPVSQAEAEAFANQLIEKFKQSDKSYLFA